MLMLGQLGISRPVTRKNCPLDTEFPPRVETGRSPQPPSDDKSTWLCTVNVVVLRSTHLSQLASYTAAKKTGHVSTLLKRT